VEKARKKLSSVSARRVVKQKVANKKAVKESKKKIKTLKR
jgi:hypothetical protein